MKNMILALVVALFGATSFANEPTAPAADPHAAPAAGEVHKDEHKAPGKKAAKKTKKTKHEKHETTTTETHPEAAPAGN